MQCPACNHIPLAGNQPDPNVCPKCNVRYSDSISQSMQKRQAQQPDPSHSVADHVKKAVAGNRGAQPVVIVDASMSFNSMVWFMVKWAIAAIPALIILILIGFFLIIFLGGIAGLGK